MTSDMVFSPSLMGPASFTWGEKESGQLQLFEVGQAPFSPQAKEAGPARLFSPKLQEDRKASI